jgi:hypothetical protein
MKQITIGLLLMSVLLVAAYPVHALNEYDMNGGNDFSLYYIKSAPETVDMYIDGKFIGLTPAKIMGLSVGDHNIVFKKTGYMDYSTKITVTKGAGGKILAAMTSNAGVVAQKSWAEIVPKCNVPCNIYINNELSGSGGKPIDLDLGTYNFKAVPTDKNYHTYNTVLNLNSAGESEFNIYLVSFDAYQTSENRLMLTIYSVPTGANVIIDNISYGITPIGIAPVSLDNHVLILKKNGYLTKEVFVEQQHDRGTQYREINVQLEPGTDPLSANDTKQASTPAGIASKITEAYASGIAKKYITIDSIEAFDDYYQFNGTREGRLWGLFDARYNMTVKVYADSSVKKNAPWYDFMVLDNPKK